MEADNDLSEIKGGRPERKESSGSHSYSMSRSNSHSRSGQKSAQDANQLHDVERDANGQIIRYKYCCKTCKHPDKIKKACVCVVPLTQRRSSLGVGCRNCGCSGCSKEDFISRNEDPEFHPDENKRDFKAKKVEGQRRQQRRQQRRDRSNSPKKNRNSPPRRNKNSRSRSKSPPEYIDPVAMKFYNFDRSLIGSMIVNEYQINPNLLGFGVPQRTQSYIFGKPK